MTDNTFSICEVSDEASFQCALLDVKRALNTLEFNEIQAAKFLTAASEVARNIIKYAGSGRLEITHLHPLYKRGIQVEAIDFGPGIMNIDLAMESHFSSSGTMGQGLPGAKRLVDEFYIESSPQGTNVTMRSWCN